MRFVVLCSSRGTTFQATLERIADGSLSARCIGLITDKDDRGCVEKAGQAKVPVEIVGHAKDESREGYDRRVDEAIEKLVTSDELRMTRGKNAKFETRDSKFLVVCMGWMFILSPWFIERWRNRILNVHPSLLPRHPGAHAHEDVLKAGDTISGMTIHVIDEGLDTGRILLQKECPVLPGDTIESLQFRVQELEKEWYPKVLGMIMNGEMKLAS